MKKSFLLFVIIVSIISYNQQASGKYILKPPEVSTVSSDGYLFAELAGDLLSVDIRDVMLNEVLHELSAQTDITFLLPPSAGEEKIMVRFSNYEVDRGLNKILASYNRIFIYTEEESNSHQLPLTRLKEVRIYPRSSEGNKKGKLEMTSIKSPGDSTRSGEQKGEGAKRTGKKKRDKGKSVKYKNTGMNAKDVRELAKDRDTKAIGFLSSALKDKNPEVRKEAEEALKEIGALLKEESEDNAQPDPGEEPAPPEAGVKNLTLSKNGVDLELSNDVPVRGVQFTLEGVKPTDIRTTSRTEGFFVREENGTVVLVSLSGNKIAPGDGPIAEIIGDNNGSARLSNIKVE